MRFLERYSVKDGTVRCFFNGVGNRLCAIDFAIVVATVRDNPTVHTLELAQMSFHNRSKRAGTLSFREFVEQLVAVPHLRALRFQSQINLSHAQTVCVCNAVERAPHLVELALHLTRDDRRSAALVAQMLLQNRGLQTFSSELTNDSDDQGYSVLRAARRHPALRVLRLPCTSAPFCWDEPIARAPRDRAIRVLFEEGWFGLIPWHQDDDDAAAAAAAAGDGLSCVFVGPISWHQDDDAAAGDGLSCVVAVSAKRPRDEPSPAGGSPADAAPARKRSRCGD